jgi:hypothetical protein
MYLHSHKEFVKKVYEEYKKIGYVECPAFPNEKIYFNQNGFRHLLRKGKKLREISAQVERLNLLKYVAKIINTSQSYVDYNKNKKDNPLDQTKTSDFWSFKQRHDGLEIIVIIRQAKRGYKHFFSVMQK